MIPKEPLVHFILIAIGLFILNYYFVSSDENTLIQIDASTVKYLEQQRAELLSREITTLERKQLIQQYINEEVLLREAYEKGLDKDVRIRQQLIKKMRALLSEDIPKPTKAELKSFYHKNRARFQTSAQITLDHLFYRSTERIPSDILKQLESSSDLSQLGDFHPFLGYHIQSISRTELARLMGGSGAAAAQVFTMKKDRWVGPITSNNGQHFFKVNLRTPAQQLSFNEVSPYLTDEWKLYQHNLLLEQKLSKLRNKYQIKSDML